MHIQLSTQKPIKLFGIKIFIERDNPNVINVLRIILQKMFFRYSVIQPVGGIKIIDKFI